MPNLYLIQINVVRKFLAHGTSQGRLVLTEDGIRYRCKDSIVYRMEIGGAGGETKNAVTQAINVSGGQIHSNIQWHY